jgi:UDP-N-acetylmuramate dehydrogenase
VTPAGLIERLRGALAGEVRADWPLAPLTTYRLGGPAALYVEAATEDDLVVLGHMLKEESQPMDVLAFGRGSNLVVSDRGWSGIVVRLGAAFSWIEPANDGAPGLRAGGATSMPLLANWAARRGLTGMEFTVAIPGSVGGAVRMNAGAHGTETGDRLTVARLFDLDRLEMVERPTSQLALSYRRSNLTDNELVVEARWHLQRSEESSIRSRMEGYRRHRAETQPGAVQNAGSVFKNPPGDAAGRLVEAAGLKGLRVGGASVSNLHANFFIAEASATAQDVYDLVHTVRARVTERLGVELEPEIRFVGAYQEPRLSAAETAGKT